MSVRISSAGGSGGVTSIKKTGSSALTGAVTLSEGSNVTLTQLGQDITIASVGNISGWTESGGTIYPTTLTDHVLIGSSTDNGSGAFLQCTGDVLVNGNMFIWDVAHTINFIKFDMASGVTADMSIHGKNSIGGTYPMQFYLFDDDLGNGDNRVFGLQTQFNSGYNYNKAFTAVASNGSLKTAINFGFDNQVYIGPTDWAQADALLQIDGTFHVNSTSALDGNITLGAKVTTYNAISTVSNGVPSELATVDLTAQGAAITATTIYAVPASGVGMYRISFVASVTRAASTSSVLGGGNGFQISYTDADDSVVKSVPTTALLGLNKDSTNTTATAIGESITVNAKESTNIQYSMGYTSVGLTTMQYNLHIKVEAL